MKKGATIIIVGQQLYRVRVTGGSTSVILTLPRCIFLAFSTSVCTVLCQRLRCDLLVLRGRDGQRVVFAIAFRFSLEHDKTFDTKSTKGMVRIRQVGFIPVWMGILNSRMTKASSFLPPRPQCQSNVELDAGAAGYLSHPVTTISQIKRPIYISLECKVV